MNITDMRSLSSDELNARVAEWQETLFRTRCNQAVGQLTNTMELRKVRRDIARAKTVINEQLKEKKTADGAE